MKLNITYDLKLRDVDGTVIHKVSTPGHSFVRQFIELLFAQMCAQTLLVRRTSGSLASVVGPDVDLLSILQNGTTRGVVVGTGTSTVLVTDFTMEGLIADGTSSGEMTHGSDVFTDPTVTGGTAQFGISRSFVNASGNSISVAEVGLHADGSVADQPHLVAREILASPIVVNNGQTLDVTAQLQITSGIPSTDTDGLVIFKTVNEVVNGSTTYQDDDELFIPVLANERWVIDAHILVDSGTTPDMKFKWTVPSGTVINWERVHLGGAPLLAAGERVESGAGVGTVRLLEYRLIVNVGSTAGNIQLQWAQNVSDASNTTVFAGSVLKGHK